MTGTKLYTSTIKDSMATEVQCAMIWTIEPVVFLASVKI